MIEIIPFMLFLIEWHPERPGEFDLQRQPVVYRTIAECRSEGAQAVNVRSASADGGMRYAFACTEIPKSEEIRDAFDREIGRALERNSGTGS